MLQTEAWGTLFSPEQRGTWWKISYLKQVDLPSVWEDELCNSGYRNLWFIKALQGLQSLNKGGFNQDWTFCSWKLENFYVDCHPGPMDGCLFLFRDKFSRKFEAVPWNKGVTSNYPQCRGELDLFCSIASQSRWMHDSYVQVQMAHSYNNAQGILSKSCF